MSNRIWYRPLKHKRQIRKPSVVALAMAACTAFMATGAASAQLPPENHNLRRSADTHKYHIERPVRTLINSSSADVNTFKGYETRGDFSKMGIERPMKSLLRNDWGGVIYPENLEHERTVKAEVLKSSWDRSRGMKGENATALRLNPTVRSDLIAGAPVAERRIPDVRKSAIELPVKSLIKTGSDSTTLSLTENFIVKEPADRLTGLVLWRKDFAEAMKQSAKSGKPVLLFHMMGRLDDRFC